MPDLSHPQFKDHVFRVSSKTPYGLEAVVAKRLEDGSVAPLGSLLTSVPFSERQQANTDQEFINDPETRMTQPVYEDPDGQGRWGGGNMDPHPDHVAWLGMKRTPGGSHLLQGLAAIATLHNGHMPAADATLSTDGAREARGAMRKYGMKPHPKNAMAYGSFTYDDSPSERDEVAVEGAASAWRSSQSSDGSLDKYWTEYSAAQAHEVVKEMDQKYRVVPRKNRQKLDPGQTSLF